MIIMKRWIALMSMLVIAGALAWSGPFQVLVDVWAPQLIEFAINPSTVTELGESVEFSANWSDYNLSYYVFRWDITGEMANDSPVDFTTTWSNLTKTITNSSDEGRNINVRIFAVDWNGLTNWTTTPSQLPIQSIKPVPSDETQSLDTVTNGSPITLSVFWTDNFEMDFAKLQIDNGSVGSFLDTGDVIQIDNKTGWTNFTYETIYIGPVSWRVVGFDKAYANETGGAGNNWNISAEMNFTVI